MPNLFTMGNLLGVVLCGGQSTRMGRDKGLMPIYETHWASYVAAKLQALPLPVVVSVNPSQVDRYGKLFPFSKLVVDNVAVEGPLKGILSVHQSYPACDLLLLACDMIDMTETTLQQLMQVYQQQPAHEFYVYQKGDFAEPLGAIYTSAGLKKVNEKVASGELSNFSMRHLLDNGLTCRISLEDEASFKNYNSLTS